ncbi:MAG: tRNA threonylcarbamoyladenosine biosynthesis protein TsaB [Candidatus Marinimicrobia bacterium]|nr:tRNA threonylcarbamoyladenosine biosynthesis protein TsaB [Candidatus Neomarinimicrobiota bacterium]
MHLLAIETATDVCSIALAEENRLMAESTIHAPRKHSELLAALISQQSENLGYDLDQLDGVAVSIGPGSFTGLRIGLSTAKGLLFSSDGALLAVPTLLASAWSVRDVADEVAVLHHSHRDTCFLAAYELNESPTEIIEPVRDSIDVLKTQLPEDMPVVYQAPNEEKLQSELPNPIIGRNRVNARNIAEVALSDMDRWAVEDPNIAEPDYLKEYEAVKFSNPLHSD